MAAYFTPPRRWTSNPTTAGDSPGVWGADNSGEGTPSQPAEGPASLGTAGRAVVAEASVGVPGDAVPASLVHPDLYCGAAPWPGHRTAPRPGGDRDRILETVRPVVDVVRRLLGRRAGIAARVGPRPHRQLRQGLAGRADPRVPDSDPHGGDRSVRPLRLRDSSRAAGRGDRGRQM